MYVMCDDIVARVWYVDAGIEDLTELENGVSHINEYE